MSFDRYEDYEAEFDPLRHDRQARRKRKPKIQHKPKKSQHEIVHEIADTTGLEGGFETTYQPGLFEEGWLLQSLRTFYDQHLITDVLARVRGGKEASVYRCQAHPSTGLDMLAAKVYRPRMFRQLRNDKMYRDGRAVLKSTGKSVKNNDHRVMRAIGKKTAYGEEVAHTSWLMYEYTTLQTLTAAGADVPESIAVSDNVILMGYRGDDRLAAATLNEVQLSDAAEARALFGRVMKNIKLMLEHNIIHGDLSAYNILYWQGEITLIDFPQVVDPQVNKQAHFILQRDVTRVCDYFQTQGVECDPAAITRHLWGDFVGISGNDLAADLSRFEVDEDDD